MIRRPLYLHLVPSRKSRLIGDWVTEHARECTRQLGSGDAGPLDQSRTTGKEPPGFVAS